MNNKFAALRRLPEIDFLTQEEIIDLSSVEAYLKDI
jgi:hypothetical protein